jgi:hypothetical protein
MMDRSRFVAAVVGLINLASSSGMQTRHVVRSLLVATLAVVDREIPSGMSREDWLAVCAHVFDSVRGKLKSEAPS